MVKRKNREFRHRWIIIITITIIKKARTRVLGKKVRGAFKHKCELISTALMSVEQTKYTQLGLREVIQVKEVIQEGGRGRWLQIKVLV